MRCFHCEEEITKGDRYQMIGLDTPYANLYFHKPDCLSEVNVVGLNTYLTLNKEKIYNYIENETKKGKK